MVTRFMASRIRRSQRHEVPAILIMGMLKYTRLMAKARWMARMYTVSRSRKLADASWNRDQHSARTNVMMRVMPTESPRSPCSAAASFSR